MTPSEPPTITPELLRRYGAGELPDHEREALEDAAEASPELSACLVEAVLDYPDTDADADDEVTPFQLERSWREHVESLRGDGRDPFALGASLGDPPPTLMSRLTGLQTMRVAAFVFFCTTAWLLWQSGVQGPGPGALVNVEIQELMPAEAETPTTRSSDADLAPTSQLLSFGSERSAVLLALAAPVVDDRADFRLRLTREAEAGPETLWQDDSVRPVSGGGFTVLLRAESFPADGSYLLRLLRLDSDDEVMVAEYEIEVTLGNDS